MNSTPSFVTVSRVLTVIFVGGLAVAVAFGQWAALQLPRRRRPVSFMPSTGVDETHVEPDLPDEQPR